MHDTLGYFQRDPIYRRYHHNELTFSLIYAFSENFILPLSHDEVVHGKGSLYEKMAGRPLAEARQPARAVWLHVGAPGQEAAVHGRRARPADEWRHDAVAAWHLLECADHEGVQSLVRDLNRVYRAEPALWELDFEPGGLLWLDAERRRQQRVRVRPVLRRRRTLLVCIANLSPVRARATGSACRARGAGASCSTPTPPSTAAATSATAAASMTEPIPWHGQPQSAEVYAAAAGDRVARPGGPARASRGVAEPMIRSSWPGEPFPLGAKLGRWRAPTSRCSASTPSASSSACSTTHNTRRAIELTERTRARTGTATCPDVGPGQRYGYRVVRPVRPREPGTRFNPAKLLIDPYAKAIDGVVDFARGANVLPTRRAASPTPTCESTTRTTPRRSRSASWSTTRSSGRATGRRASRSPTRSSTRRTCTGFTMRTRMFARTCAAPTPGSRRTPAIDYLHDLGVTAVELLPVHHICDEPFLAERGLRTTGATARSASSRRTRDTRRPAGAASRSRSSRAWSRRCTAPASR